MAKKIKISIIFGIIYSLVYLTSCNILRNFTKSYYYEYDDLKEGLTGIEIVHVNTDGQTMELLSVLEEEEYEKCLKSICQIEFVVPLGTPTVTVGCCIKLNYGNEYLRLGVAQAGYFKEEKVERIEGCPINAELILDLMKYYVELPM